MYCTSRYLILLLLLMSLAELGFSHTDKYRCMWREDPATTMVIGWNQISGRNPVLYFGMEDQGKRVDAYPFSQAPDRVLFTKGMNNHYVRLAGLEPSTVYYFVIADNEGVSRRMSFRTAPDNPYERLSIIAGGDSRNHRNARVNANKIVGKIRPHFVLFGGDMTGGDNATQWKNWMDDWQHTISVDGRLTPIVPARGNHEYSNRTIVDLFDVKNSNVYYGLNFGGELLRIYTLNSLIASGGEQADWLARDLKRYAYQRWKIAQYHFATRPHTRRKSERKDQWRNWSKLFFEHGVQLVVESDAHVVKWTYPIRPSTGIGSEEGFIRDDDRGTVYVGEGCWGAPVRRSDDDKKWTRNSGSFNQFKWIFVDEDKIEIRTIMTDNGDEIGALNDDDRFSIPYNLKLWEPSNGALVTIPARPPHAGFRPLAQANSSDQYQQYPVAYSVPARPQIEVPQFTYTFKEQKQQLLLRWSSRSEPGTGLIYELQRSLGQEPFITVAKIEGQGNKSNQYEIVDPTLDVIKDAQVRYRLRHNLAGRMPQTLVVDIEELQQAQLWAKYKPLHPDPATKLLKVKYAIDAPSEVKIELVDVQQQVISKTAFQNRSSGRYQQSIDMRQVPVGRYLLTIRSGDEVIDRFQVLN